MSLTLTIGYSDIFYCVSTSEIMCTIESEEAVVVGFTFHFQHLLGGTEEDD
jgi:hypothetical protein